MVVFTPYDWQEGIGHRAQYIQSKLAQGSPVVAVSLPSGILVYTRRRQARKIYEIYDRILFAGIGQQSDVEAVRVAALEFASKEGFSRSEEDVTVQRVAVAVSTPLKKAFSDFSSSPIVARTLFAEVNETLEQDLYYALDYDGDYSVSRFGALIEGRTDGAAATSLVEELRTASPEDAFAAIDERWVSIAFPEGLESDAALEGLKPEAVLLERSAVRENRFRLLTPDDF